ncbi:response regulator [Haliscomenobacter sp.]|uniref:response regulator n=1 Tax=Haliscomenobacter sp. TaxID=2717303 RepID=UPI003BADA115
MSILVVDDETDIRALFEQKFRKEIRENVFTFEFAHSGEAALELLKKTDSNIILILSDINMPGMSGLELLRRVRGIYPEAPPKVFMVTAYGDKENRERANVLGADDFLTKPIDFSNLKEKLHE